MQYFRFSSKVVLLCVFFAFDLYAMTLKEGLELALDNDPEVLTRKNSIVSIGHEVDAAKGLYRPKLDFVGKMQKEGYNGSLIPADNYNRKSDSWEFVLTQPLIDGGDAAYEESLQLARLDSARYYMLESANKVALRYIESYLNTLREKDNLRLANESYTINKDIFEKIKKKVDKGFGTRLEYERAKTKIEESTTNLTTQKINYREAKIGLRNFVQEDFDTDELVMPLFYFDLPKDFEGALDTAMQLHPSMKVSTNNVNVALYEHKRDLKAFYPKVDFVGRYKTNNTIYDGDDQTDEYSLGVEIKYNLYNGGRDEALREKALKNVDEKKISIEKSKQEVENRLRLAWNAYEMNEKKVKELENYVISRKDVLDTSFEEFDLGTVDLTTLLKAEEDYITAKRSALSSTYDFLLAKYRILEGMGVLVNNIILDEGRFATLQNTRHDSYASLSEGGYSYTTRRSFKKERYDKIALSTAKNQEIPALLSEESARRTNFFSALTPQTQEECYLVTARSLNIRATSDLSAKVIGGYRKGEKICGAQKEDGWLKTTTGWVSAAYLSPVSIETEEVAETSSEETLSPKGYPLLASDKTSTSSSCYKVNADYLNARKGAGLSENIVGQYKEGAIVCEEAKEGDWLLSAQGWVNTAYLEKMDDMYVIADENSKFVALNDSDKEEEGLCFFVKSIYANIYDTPDENGKIEGNLIQDEKFCIKEEAYSEDKHWVQYNKGWIKTENLGTNEIKNKVALLFNRFLIHR